MPSHVSVREFDEAVHAERSLCCHEPLLGGPRSFPQFSGADERFDRRRQGVLALVEPNHRLEALEQC